MGSAQTQLLARIWSLGQSPAVANVLCWTAWMTQMLLLPFLPLPFMHSSVLANLQCKVSVKLWTFVTRRGLKWLWFWSLAQKRHSQWEHHGAGIAFLDSVDRNLKCRGPDTGHCSSWSGRWFRVCVCCVWVGIRRQKRSVTLFTWIPQRNCSSTKIGWMCAEQESTGLDLSEVESKQPLYSLSVRCQRRQLRKEDRPCGFTTCNTGPSGFLRDTAGATTPGTGGGTWVYASVPTLIPP